MPSANQSSIRQYRHMDIRICVHICPYMRPRAENPKPRIHPPPLANYRQAGNRMNRSPRRTDPTSNVVAAMRNARRARQLALAAIALSALGGFSIAAYNATKAEGADLTFLSSSVFAGSMLLVFAFALPPNAAKRICARLRDREPLYKAAATVFFGLTVSILMSYWATQITQRQMEIADRETAPQLAIASFEDDGAKYYEISNAKGMASYVTLQVEERYRFQSGGETYEIGLAFPMGLASETSNLNSSNKAILFRQECSDFKEADVYDTLRAHLSSKGTDPDYLSQASEITVSFFDHDGQRRAFVFCERDGKILLSSTDAYRYIPERNLTGFLWPGEDAGAAACRLADEVMEERF